MTTIADDENATERRGECPETRRARQNEHQHDLITRSLDGIGTGEDLSATKRMVFQLADGLITRIDEYHDAAKVEAFMRLAAQRTEADEVMAPPELPKARRQYNPR